MRLVLTTLVLLSAMAATMPARAQALSSDAPGCEGAIGRWQAFATQENQGGHMDQTVFDKIQSEIERATALCRSGRDAQASKMIEASMRRHGY